MVCMMAEIYRFLFFTVYRFAFGFDGPLVLYHHHIYPPERATPSPLFNLRMPLYSAAGDIIHWANDKGQKKHEKK